MKTVWIFNGTKSRYPSAVFSSKELAEQWIELNKVEGILTEYPIDISVYDWTLQHDYFKNKNGKEITPEFIANFSSASQNHEHYENN